MKPPTISRQSRFAGSFLSRRMSRKWRKNGFVLVAVLMMMILLVVAAVGLLSLSSIALRNSSTEGAAKAARANSRIALFMALGELQRQLGDDRRVTADAALVSDTSPRPQMVGVWNSYKDLNLLNPSRTPVGDEYTSRKTGDNFRGWLISAANPEDTEDTGFATAPVSSDDIELFREEMDGYDMSAGLVEINAGQKNRGGVAWAVSQAATKASINTGVEYTRLSKNDVLQAPDRANVGLSGIATQPTDGWDTRHGKVLNMKQAVLDTQYGLSKTTLPAFSREHTARSLGVLSDVANGGLKKDLSLAFELSDADFRNGSLDGMTNPFSGPDPGGERRLYYAASGTGGTTGLFLDYRVVKHMMPLDTGTPPTFNSLRSHYRAHKYMYDVGGVPTAAQRFLASPSYNNAGAYASRGSETSLNPVLDRVLLYFSATIDPSTRLLSLLITPVITLWNPYDVAIECDGYVAYPSVDMPMWLGGSNNGQNISGGASLSQFMGRGQGGEAPYTWNNKGEGRMGEAYFYCRISQSGTDNISAPVRIEPGEVRVFGPATSVPVAFNKFAADASPNRTVWMKPTDRSTGINTKGGLRIPINQKLDGGTGMVHQVRTTDNISLTLDFGRSGDNYHYFMTLEDAARIHDSTLAPLAKIPKIAEAQIFNNSGATNAFITAAPASGTNLIREPQVFGVLETYHRTAGSAGPNIPPSDIVHTVNPRHRYTNYMLSGATQMPSAHYATHARGLRDIPGDIQSEDNSKAFYGKSHSSGGVSSIAFFEIPREPMMSIGAFQNADLANSAFAPAYQVGNSWASAYVPADRTVKVLPSTDAEPKGSFSPSAVAIYDQSYLLNAAIWDSTFLSSIAPVSTLAGARPSNMRSAYDGSPRSRQTRSIEEVVTGWIEDPKTAPLRNTRHIFHSGGVPKEEVIEKLSGQAGTLHAAAHILVDGSFNVNSVNENAWRAMFASLRGTSFGVTSATGNVSDHAAGNDSPLPRLSHPRGNANNIWEGFRQLSDGDIENLAEEMVKEVRLRGPFQSVAEFVNRRLTSGTLGQKGAMQAAIDNAGINNAATVERSSVVGYPHAENIAIRDTGVGIPGWLTQGDVLTSMGPFITVRSDTFTIRAYGDSRDANGNIIARSWCEAEVQRVPDWVDPTDKASDPIENLTTNASLLTETNQKFGRRFEIVSIREISQQEFDL